MSEPTCYAPELFIAFREEQLRYIGGPPGLRDLAAWLIDEDGPTGVD